MWRRLWILNFLKIIVRLKKQLSVRPVTPSRNHALTVTEKVKQRMKSTCGQKYITSTV